jgi:fatty-acyl-CoA synthase
MDYTLFRHTLGDIVRRSAARTPHKMAIQCGSVGWTYAEFDSICNRLARGLRALGVAFGDRVAILARNSHAYVAVRFAVARLGAVLVPVNFMLRESEVAYILRHSGATVLCTDPGLEPVAHAAAALDTAVWQIVMIPDEDGTCSDAAPAARLTFNDLLSGDDAPVEADVRGDSLAQIVYTSGTESLPKGVMLTHDAILWEYVTCIADAEISESDLALHSMPLFHVAQLDVFLGPAIYVGASNFITSKPIPDNLLTLLSKYQITSFFVPPTVWIAMLRSVAFQQHDLSALRKAYYGASIMPVEILRELLTRLPQVRFWNLYGQTELAAVATALKPQDQLRKAGSAGKAALNVETRLVDDEDRDVPTGEIGEIVHRSPQLLQGYFKDEERTREAFRGGWFHSGDLARMDSEGYITIVDRKKDVIKTGGENVASREVEEMLYGHPCVAEVAVIGVPHEKWVEAVLAVIVLKQDQATNEAALLSHCGERLAHFKVPKRVIFVDKLPKNPSGKLLKRELRQLYAGVFATPAIAEPVTQKAADPASATALQTAARTPTE